MPKELNDEVLDAPCDYVADNGDRIVLCSAMPTSYLEANSTYMLLQHTLIVGDGNGDYTVADGEASGRKLTVAQQSDVAITNTGQVNYAALLAVGANKILAVTTVAPQVLTAEGTATIPSFAIRWPDPV